MEFSVRLCSSADEWIPLKFIYLLSGVHPAISLGERGPPFHLRGYMVDAINATTVNGVINTSIDICNVSSSDYIQFRWLQTSFLNFTLSPPRDVWFLEYVKITLTTSSSDNLTLIEDNFDSNDLE